MCGLEDGDGVVRKEERDDESAVDVLGNLRIEACSIPQHGLVVVHILEEIALRLLRDQLEHVAQGVCLITEAIMGWDLPLDRLWNLRALDSS